LDKKHKLLIFFHKNYYHELVIVVAPANYFVKGLSMFIKKLILIALVLCARASLLVALPSQAIVDEDKKNTLPPGAAQTQYYAYLSA